MKRLSLQLIALCISLQAFGQNVGIGTTEPVPSAILELKATNRGFLPPRMDSSQRVAIANPAKGLMVYDTDRNMLLLYNGIRWVSLDQTNTTGGSISRPNPSYTFSSPQFLVEYSSPNGIGQGHNGITLQSASISENLIVTATGVDLGSSPSHTTCSFGINRNGTTTLNMYTVPGYGKLYCFDADSLEQNIYAVINTSLFRLNINNPQDTSRIADDLGSTAQIKVRGNSDIIVSTDQNNGSLLRILPNGTKQIIASNLRFPNYFDIFNNNYYVTDLSAITGIVKKVNPAGVATTVVADIISPRSIVFDKNGNFVLQSNVTLVGGNVFIKYDLYDANGQLLGPVNDASDNSILTSTGTLISPLYVDNFNNLVFSHQGIAGTTYIPNPVGANGIWVLKLNKL